MERRKIEEMGGSSSGMYIRSIADISKLSAIALKGVIE